MRQALTPNDAFTELLSNFNQQGIIVGINCLDINVYHWYDFIIPKQASIYLQNMACHSWYLSIAFILIAVLHVVNMGRHINNAMVWIIAILAIAGVAMLTENIHFQI